MRFSVGLFASATALALTATAASSRPIDGWWTGGAQGVVEHGYKRKDGTDILLSCEPGRGNAIYLSVQIENLHPSNTYVVFSIEQQDHEFYVDRLGSINMDGSVQDNEAYFLYDSIRAGKSMTVRFSPHSITDGDTQMAAWQESVKQTTKQTTISLAGTGRILRSDLCD